MHERLKISLPIIVEGKYDKNTLLQIVDAPVITTGGFSVFNSRQKQEFLKKLACRGGVIVLTDSDAGGDQIRRFLAAVLPKEKVYNLYIPRIAGKEKRKSKPSKSGVLGVEGMPREVVEKVLAPFADGEGVSNKPGELNVKMITKLDFFEDGLSGGKDSSDKRAALARYFGLPETLTSAALIEALNLTVGYGNYKKVIEELFENEADSI